MDDLLQHLCVGGITSFTLTSFSQLLPSANRRTVSASRSRRDSMPKPLAVANALASNTTNPPALPRSRISWAVSASRRMVKRVVGKAVLKGEGTLIEVLPERLCIRDEDCRSGRGQGIKGRSIIIRHPPADWPGWPTQQTFRHRLCSHATKVLSQTSNILSFLIFRSTRFLSSGWGPSQRLEHRLEYLVTVEGNRLRMNSANVSIRWLSPLATPTMDISSLPSEGRPANSVRSLVW